MRLRCPDASRFHTMSQLYQGRGHVRSLMHCLHRRAAMGSRCGNCGFSSSPIVALGETRPDLGGGNESCVVAFAVRESGDRLDRMASADGRCVHLERAKATWYIFTQRAKRPAVLVTNWRRCWAHECGFGR